MLSAVVPFAIEQGLIAATPGTTTARVHNVNTGKLIDVTVSTPGGRVTYEGDAVIDGVPGSAAPILMTFLDVAGAKTGRLLPTGQAQDEIDGLPSELRRCRHAARDPAGRRSRQDRARNAGRSRPGPSFHGPI